MSVHHFRNDYGALRSYRFFIIDVTLINAEKMENKAPFNFSEMVNAHYREKKYKTVVYCYQKLYDVYIFTIYCRWSYCHISRRARTQNIYVVRARTQNKYVESAHALHICRRARTQNIQKTEAQAPYASNSTATVICVRFGVIMYIL